MSQKLNEYDLSQFFPRDQQNLFQECVLVASEKVLPRLTFLLGPALRMRTGYRIKISNPEFHGKIRMMLGPGSGDIEINTAGPANLDLRIWRDVSVKIGEGTTINSARIVCDNADITIGDDGLWSDDILVQSNDQHGIVDLETMELTNKRRRYIHIDDHVWIGRRAILMPDTIIGKGAILAAGAVLTSTCPAHTVFAGVPARKVRENTSWSRNPNSIADHELRFF